MAETDTENKETQSPQDTHQHRFNLDRMSAEELKALRDAAERKRREVVEKQASQAFSEFQERIREAGLSVEEVLSRYAPDVLRALAKTQRRRRSPGGQAPPDEGTREPLPVVFRDPDHPEHIWRERGQKPKWLQDYEKQGRDPEEFRIRPRKSPQKPKAT